MSMFQSHFICFCFTGSKKKCQALHYSWVLGLFMTWCFYSTNINTLIKLHSIIILSQLIYHVKIFFLCTDEKSRANINVSVCSTVATECIKQTKHIEHRKDWCSQLHSGHKSESIWNNLFNLNLIQYQYITISYHLEQRKTNLIFKLFTE